MFFWPRNRVFWLKNRFFWPKNRVFWPKNRKLFPNLFLNYFCDIFASLKRPNISKKILNFKNRTIPKLAKTKSSKVRKIKATFLITGYISKNEFFSRISSLFPLQVLREQRLKSWRRSVISVKTFDFNVRLKDFRHRFLNGQR